MRAADDGHVLPTLALPADLLSRSLRVAHSERTSLEQLPRNAFEVRGLLSDAECDALVKVVEARGFGDISWEYDPVRGQCSFAFCPQCRHRRQIDSTAMRMLDTSAPSAVAGSHGVSPVHANVGPQTYRSCTRLVVSVPDLAAELWRRLRPLLHLEDIQNVRVCSISACLLSRLMSACASNIFTDAQVGASVWIRRGSE